MKAERQEDDDDGSKIHHNKQKQDLLRELTSTLAVRAERVRLQQRHDHLDMQHKTPATDSDTRYDTIRVNIRQLTRCMVYTDLVYAYRLSGNWTFDFLQKNNYLILAYLCVSLSRLFCNRSYSYFSQLTVAKTLVKHVAMHVVQ